MKHILKYSLGCLAWMTATITILSIVSCDDETASSDLYEATYPKSVVMNIPEALQEIIYVDKSGANVLPMIKGGTASLSYTFAPDNITFKEFNWTSSDTNIATVDENGLVTAVGGDDYAIIQIAPSVYYSGSNIYSALKVAVSNVLIPAETITVNSSVDEVFAGETMQFSASILPDNSTYKTVKWSTSDANVATIDERSGLMTALPTGVAFAPVTITATSMDGVNVVGTKEIIVKETISPQSITIDQTHSVANGYYCAINEKYLALSIATVPADATQSLIEWTSSDESIATVSNGVVTFNNLHVSDNANNPVPMFGDVTITGTCPETGNSASIKLNIAEGLVREVYHDKTNYTWYNAAQSGNGTSSSHVWSYGKVTVTTYTQNSTAQRGDFKCWSPRTYLHAGNYPIIAIRIDDLMDREEVTTRNITLDGSGDCGGAKFSGGLNGNNNKWLHDYKCSDGSHVFIYNMATQGWATGGVLPNNTVAVFPTLQFKYADIKTLTQQVTYNAYWVQTFKTIDDVQAYIKSEGLTYDIIK